MRRLQRVDELMAMSLRLAVASKKVDAMLEAARAADFNPGSLLALESARQELRQLLQESLQLRKQCEGTQP